MVNSVKLPEKKMELIILYGKKKQKIKICSEKTNSSDWQVADLSVKCHHFQEIQF